MKFSTIKPKITSRIFSCDNGATVNFLLELSFDRLFNQADADLRLSANKIEVSIKHPTMELEPIGNIDIDSDMPDKYAVVNPETKGIKKGAEHGCYLVTQYQFVDNKRIFTINSPVQLKNCVSKQLSIRLENGVNVIEISLLKDEAAAVPFDYIDKGTLAIFDPTNPQLSGPRINILSLAQTVGMKKTIQVPCGTENYIIKAAKYGKVVHLEFKPPFIIKNCCPVTVGCQLFYAKEEKSTAKNLKEQEEYEIMHLSRDKNVFMKIRPQGFWWSSETIIYHKAEDPTPKNVLVVGIDGTSMTIGVQLIREEQGSYKIYIYSKAMIINETLHDLVYYVCEEEQDEDGHLKSILPGLNPVFPNEDFNPKIALYGDSKKLAIALKKFPNHASEPFAVGVIGDQPIMIENRKQKYAVELGINLSIVPAGISSFINI